MKQQVMAIIGTVAYMLAAVVLAWYAWWQFTPERTLSPAGRLAALLTACGLMYVGGRLLSPRMDKRWQEIPMKVNLWVWFGLYLLLLATLTLFDPYYGRGGGLSLASWNRQLLQAYLTYNFNIIPGHMVIDMILSVMNGNISLKMALVNIFGNLAALMPAAFFLPQLFERQRKFKTFALTVGIMVAVIEITQFATLSGTFDIDDWILNVGGACLMYKLMETPKAKRWIEQFLGKEEMD